eukprot:Gb_36182 [translate_table: standard]
MHSHRHNVTGFMHPASQVREPEAHPAPGAQVRGQKISDASRKEDALPSIQAAAARATSRTVAAVAQNMTAPKTAYEFEATWKGFSGDRSAQSELLKIMAPASLPKIFKDALSAPLLMDIIRCVELFFMENVDFAVQFLESLTKVGRFDMTIMCLSSRDKAGMGDISAN